MMVIKTKKTEIHWNYFLAIESELEIISRYVEFDKKNFECFSIELSRILLTAAAEAGVVCKQLCQQLKPSSKADNIDQYRDEILSAYPDLVDFEVVLPRYGMALKPWSEWKKAGGVPFWWTAYNKIKHNRDSEYLRANLHNALNSVAGLYVVLIYFYKDKAISGELVPSPLVLRPGEDHFTGMSMGSYEFGIGYKIQ